jgi:transposase-like protein
MRKEDPVRRFSREFKLAAVRRMAAGANVSKLSRELGVSRKGLYQWQKQFRAGWQPEKSDWLTNRLSRPAQVRAPAGRAA